MRRTIDKHNNFGIIWYCRTANFIIELRFEQSYERYDGDDEDGSIQRDLDNGDLVTFDSRLTVYADTRGPMSGKALGWSSIGASVYKDGETYKFIKDGYFKDMLNEACTEAREAINNMPKLRAGKE